MTDLPDKPAPRGEFILYRSEDGTTTIHVRYDAETVWLTQLQLAELFRTSVPNVNTHIRNLLTEGELDEARTIKDYLIVRQEGSRRVSRMVTHYNLDMILAIGYRVRSPRGTQFRQWATNTLREYLTKGFVLDDQRLKDARNLPGGRDYFEELLERIRDIRASERRFYQKITDIYATSVDYDADAPVTREFFATVQNKLHWAIHGHTAAEVVVERADATRPHMGLTTWRNAPAGLVRRADVAVAKNYLSAEELSALNRIVTMYLDYADLQARQRREMRMADWVARLDAFLQFNEQNILTHAGKVSAEMAREHAEGQFARYEADRRAFEVQNPTSDFDRFLAETRRLPPPPAPSE
jgi:hypothetical protein